MCVHSPEFFVCLSVSLSTYLLIDTYPIHCAQLALFTQIVFDIRVHTHAVAVLPNLREKGRPQETPRKKRLGRGGKKYVCIIEKVKKESIISLVRNLGLFLANFSQS